MDPKAAAALQGMGQQSALGSESKLFRAGFYGEPGSGKTSLALMIAMALGEKVLFVTTDSAWTVLHKYTEYKDRIHRIPYAGFTQIKSIPDARLAGMEPYASCQTIVWDQYSSGVDNYLRTLVDTKKSPQITKQMVDPLVEGWPHYRIAARAIQDTITRLNESDLNVIYISHSKDPSEADKEKKRYAIRPDMPEACFKAMSKEVAMLGYMYKEKKGSDRLIQLEGTIQVTAKSQISTIPEDTYSASEIPALIKNWRDN